MKTKTARGACRHRRVRGRIKDPLTPGKLTDITVLSKDITTVPEDEIPSTEVVCTIVGGKVMYEKKGIGQAGRVLTEPVAASRITPSQRRPQGP